MKEKRRESYASLHNHTHYSNLRLIDAINTEETLIDRAYELGLPAVAITDHESVSGHIKALNYYNKHYGDKKDEFKLILGNEIYLTRSGLNAETHQKGEKFYHLILLAKDNTGHKQLRELSSRAWRRGYYKNIMRVPTFIEDLAEIIQVNPGHVIATTACLGGYTASMFLMNEINSIQPFLDNMVNIFGKDNFFIELQPRKDGEQLAYNRFMIINYWGDYNFIFTTDSHYLKKEDQEVHRWFLQSKTSSEREVDSYYETAYMMSWEELKSFFDFYISPQKIEIMRRNTLKIMDSIEGYNLDHGQIVPTIRYEKEKLDFHKINKVIEIFKNNNVENYFYINKFITTENAPNKYLMQLILQGYYDKIYKIKKHKKEVSTSERMDRLNYELEQIYETSVKINQSLSDYFITMSKMIEIIWEKANSLVGPGRGSASGFLVNYLIGITQIDPQDQMLYLPPWRFIHKDRPGLPDIDIDTESAKRLKIFNKIREYFNTIGSDVINVCTFGTEGSKSAIRTAGRSLKIEDETINYLGSMIPNERGFDLTLHQCYFGDENHNPIKEFVREMDKNPKLKKLTFAIEGLITRLGSHAGGVLILKGDIAEHNSVMQTNSGVIVSAYNLEDTEQMGGLKYDMLTVAALDKTHAALNYLLEDRVITWEGSLKDTYNKYLLPANLEYDDPKMWKSLWDGEIIDAFQFDTMVGSQAIKLIQPANIKELAIANSIMRLMAQDGMELPLDTFIRNKNNLNEWYAEMKSYGLNEEDIAILEPHLKTLYGVADSQEAAMQLVMDKKIVGFTLNEANSLRKAIAKKKASILEKTKQLYDKKGKELGTDPALLEYVWKVQIGRQIG